MIEAKPQTDALQCVRFNLGSASYAINTSQVQRVLRAIESTPVPGAPGFILGLVNLRGSVVAIMDLCRRMGLDRGCNDELSRIILVESDDQTVGLLVDSVSDVIRIDPAKIEPEMYAQQLQSEPYVYAVIKQQGQSINLLDLDRLIAESAVSRMDRPDFSG